MQVYEWTNYNISHAVVLVHDMQSLTNQYFAVAQAQLGDGLRSDTGANIFAQINFAPK